MKFTPHPYQIRSAEHMVKHKECALFLDMGLGKTVITLSTIRFLITTDQIKSCLIIAPLRVIYNVWPQEIEKWEHLQYLTHTILHGKDKYYNLTDKPVHIYLMNYDSIPWLYNTIRNSSKTKLPFNMIVYDESSAIKSHRTKRFKCLRGLSRIFDRKVILTGTPAPNSLLDLWAQYYLLDDGKRLDTSWTRFRQTYFTQKDYFGYKWEPLPNASQILSKKVEDITIRLRGSDYLSLPKRTHNKIMCVLPVKAQKQYKTLENEFILQIKNEIVTAANAGVMANKLRQFTSGGLYSERKPITNIHTVKLDALEEIVDSYYGKPLLIAIQFRFEYDIIKQKFPKVPIIYGGTKLKESQKLINQWNKKELPLLVVHPASIAHGVNLQQGGNILIWFNLPWSYEQYIQLIKRIDRQGQTQPTFIHHILLKNTIDEYVYKVLQKKEYTETTFLNLLLDSLKGV